MTPIVITTGVGPGGWKAVWYQPLSDDPPVAATTSQLTQPVAPSPSPGPPSTPTRSFRTNITTQTSTNITMLALDSATPPTNSAKKRGLKTSTVSHEAVEKARANIEKVPQKHALLDTLIKIQEYVPFFSQFLYSIVLKASL